MNNEQIMCETIHLILKSIDISDSAYEEAERRYRDFGDFLCNGTECSSHEAYVFLKALFALELSSDLSLEKTNSIST